MVMTNENTVLCPECGVEMRTSGKIWSGRVYKQRYACPGCGRKTVMPKSNSRKRGS